MLKPELSIIVPVYKIKESYLRQCIDSLVTQTLRSVQIILIDDGSPDRCGEICDEYANRDDRVIAIHQNNSGVSVARNAGLNTADGTYIMFVDADDWLELDCCELVLDVIRRQNCDMLYFQCQREDEIHNQVKRFPQVGSRKLEGEELQKLQLDALASYYNTFGFDPIVPWAKVFKRDFLQKNDLKYPIGIKKCQDVLFSVYYLDYLRKAYFYDYVGYHYRINEDSICQRHNPDMLTILLSFLHAAEQFVVNNHPDDIRFERSLGLHSIFIHKTLRRTLFFHPNHSVSKKEFADYMECYYNDSVVDKYINKCRLRDCRSYKDILFFLLITRRHVSAYYYLLWVYSSITDRALLKR